MTNATTEVCACTEFVAALSESRLILSTHLPAIEAHLKSAPQCKPASLANFLVDQGIPTRFQADTALQGKAKDMGRPWEVGKALEASAPCSAIVPADRIGHPTSGVIWLDVNGQRKQTGDLNQMIWKVPEMISYLSGLITLMPGDVILSGTPAGVGAVNRGDVMKGHVDGVGDIEVRVV